MNKEPGLPGRTICFSLTSPELLFLRFTERASRTSNARHDSNRALKIDCGVIGPLYSPYDEVRKWMKDLTIRSVVGTQPVTNG